MPYAETASANRKFRKEKIANTTKIIELELEEDTTKISDLWKVSSERNQNHFVSPKNDVKNAFVSRQIQAAVKRVALEEDRSKSLIFFGLPETEENLHAKVSGILLDNLYEKPRILSCKRVGKDTSTSEWASQASEIHFV